MSTTGDGTGISAATNNNNDDSLNTAEASMYSVNLYELIRV